MTKNIPTKAMLVAWLKNGDRESFNKYRPEGEVDLTRVKLPGHNLTGFNLNEVNFILAILPNAIFDDCLVKIKFSLAVLDGSNILDVDTSSCSGVPIKFNKSILENPLKDSPKIRNPTLII